MRSKHAQYTYIRLYEYTIYHNTLVIHFLCINMDEYRTEEPSHCQTGNTKIITVLSQQIVVYRVAIFRMNFYSFIFICLFIIYISFLFPCVQ